MEPSDPLLREDLTSVPQPPPEPAAPPLPADSQQLTRSDSNPLNSVPSFPDENVDVPEKSENADMFAEMLDSFYNVSR